MAEASQELRIERLCKCLQRNLIVFVGAGVSAAVGYPTWTGFASQLLDNISQLPDEDLQELQLSRKRLVSAISAPATIVGGNSCNGTVTLNASAGPGGANVTVATGNQIVTVTSQPSISQGATSGQFTLSTSAVSANTVVTIAAKLNGSYKARTIEVLAPTVSALALVPSQVVGGTSSTATVTLNANAAASGALVILASGKPSVASVQASVTVPSQQSSATFTVTTSAVGADTVVNILAGANGSTRVQALTVKGPTVQAMQLSPNPVVGGNICTGTLTLSSAAPSGGMNINLYTGNSAFAPVSATVPVTGGSTTAPFSINTNAVAADLNVNILARVNGSSATQVLKLLGPKISGLQLNPDPVVGGNQCTGTITLSSAAPASGMTVNLYSGNSTVASVQATVQVPANSNTASFTISTNATLASINVTILAKANGSSLSKSLLVVKS